MNPKISNIRSRAGNEIPNQFRIETDQGIFFQSYRTTIALRKRNGQIILDPSFRCSNTTSKYRAIFLNESTAETVKKIDSGEYKIQNLN